MSTFPSTLSSYTDPVPTNRLNTNPHSSIESAQNSGLKQLEAVIGVAGASSVVGTYEYFVKSPASNGGGHVQTANKGGTGQTSYNKGDILVATSSSVLSKLAVSSVLNDVLIADPNASAGLKWATNPNSNKIALNTSSVIVSGTDSQTLFSATIPGSTLGVSNGIKFKGEVRVFGQQDNLTMTLNYGVNSVATMTVPTITPTSLLSGYIEGYLLANSSSVLQIGYMDFWAANKNGGRGTDLMRAHGLASGFSSINSTANQTLSINANYAARNPLSSMTAGIFIVEKIS